MTIICNIAIKVKKRQEKEKAYFFVEIVVEPNHVFEGLEDFDAQLLFLLLEQLQRVLNQSKEGDE